MVNLAVRDLLQPLIRAGRVATCGVVELEILFSARSTTEIEELQATRAKAFHRIPTTDADFARAEQVVHLLAKKGRHRSVGIPDLLVAAVAENAGLTLIHYDQDFDRIAAVTGQPAIWVAPRGSLD